MKKLISLLLVGAMVLGLTACSKSSNDNTQSTGGSTSKTTTETQSSNQSSEKKKAILIVNGNLGDLGFFDSANAGMQRVKNELGLDIQVIETGDDESKWEPALADAAEEDVDYVIAVSPSMVEPIQNIAPQYPEKKFLLLDNTVDYEAGDFSNVYCATFKQNEGSFLLPPLQRIQARLAL